MLNYMKELIVSRLLLVLELDSAKEYLSKTTQMESTKFTLLKVVMLTFPLRVKKIGNYPNMLRSLLSIARILKT